MIGDNKNMFEYVACAERKVKRKIIQNKISNGMRGSIDTDT